MRGATSWCGVTAEDHRSTKCKDCLRLRMKAWRAKRRATRPLTGPSCVLCGITRGNTLGIPVYRYPLVRNIQAIGSNRCIGSIPMCDPCVAEYATPSPSYIRANGRGFGKAA